MKTTLKSMLASFERRKASERVTDHAIDRFNTGHVLGGSVYGFRPVRSNPLARATWEIDERQGEVVCRIFKNVTNGLGFNKIAAALTAEGQPSPGDVRAAGAATRQARKEGKDIVVEPQATGWTAAAIHEIVHRTMYE